MAHLTFFCFSKILLSIPVVVHILIPYRLLLLHSQSLSHSFIYFIPRHSPFTCQWTFIVLQCSLLIAEWYAAPSHVHLRPMSMTYFVWALDCRASSLSYLSLNCSYSDFFIYDFSWRSEYTYFFRRKVSASRILQVSDTLFPEFFQKLFAVCRASNKNFSGPSVK